MANTELQELNSRLTEDARLRLFKATKSAESGLQQAIAVVFARWQGDHGLLPSEEQQLEHAMRTRSLQEWFAEFRKRPRESFEDYRVREGGAQLSRARMEAARSLLAALMKELAPIASGDELRNFMQREMRATSDGFKLTVPETNAIWTALEAELYPHTIPEEIITSADMTGMSPQEIHEHLKDTPNYRNKDFEHFAKVDGDQRKRWLKGAKKHNSLIRSAASRWLAGERP